MRQTWCNRQSDRHYPDGAEHCSVCSIAALGILADRLKSTKTIPMLTLLVMCAGYAFLGSVPALGERRMELFFVSLAFTAGALAIYNAQWQAMFGAAFHCGSETMSMPFGISSCL